jgi:hypothetical protein
VEATGMRFYKMNLNFVRILAVGVATVGCVFNASATTTPDVSYKIGGSSDLLQFDNIDFTIGGKTTVYNNIYAGGEQISQPSGSNDGLPNNYISICTDFLGSLYGGSTYKYLGSPVSMSSASAGIDPGWNNKTLAIANASYLFNTYGDLGSGGLGTGNKAGISVEDMAALQLAVWMVLYDTGSNGNVTMNSSSEFYISSTSGDSSTEIAAVGLADSYVANLTGNYKNIDSVLQPDTSLGYQGNPDNEYPQELMYSSVPEPATVLAGILLLLPLGVTTIRNLRKSQVK